MAHPDRFPPKPITPDTIIRIPIQDIQGDLTAFPETIRSMTPGGHRIRSITFEPYPHDERSGVAILQTERDLNPRAPHSRPYALHSSLSEADYKTRSGQ